MTTTYCISVLLFLLFPLFVNADAAEKNQPITDGDITRAVEWQLAFDEAVPSHWIDVNTRNGVVRLEGSVDDLMAKERARQRAEATRGVRSVINLIAVQPVQRADETIERDIEWALIRDPATDRYKIAVKVDRKIATLTGTVESWQEKEVAAEVAKGVKGLVGLNNEITVNYQAQTPDAQIAADVKRRLESDVLVDAERILVDVDDGNVYLTGEVGSAAEKSRAIRDGWVAGVKSVGARGLEIQPQLRNPFQEPEYAYRTDKEIERSIQEAFRYDPRVREFRIEAEVRNGEAVLAGTVDHLAAKAAAENNARHTAGVWLVRNHLKVRPDSKMTDEQISQNIKRALENDPAINVGDIAVRVFNKKAYLSGSVDSRFERNRAADVVARVNGVAAIQNNINPPVLRQSRSDWELQRDIEEKLRWSAVVNSQEVEVGVANGVATLSGTVDDLAERRVAVNNALEAGARGVINKLKVRQGPASLRR